MKQEDRLLAQARANDAPAAGTSAADTYRQLALFGLIFDQVRAHYVEDPDVQKLVEGAVGGMLNSLDPHSSYMNSKSFGEMQVETSGSFGGAAPPSSIRTRGARSGSRPSSWRASTRWPASGRP